ncbi:hypothetical protein AKJ39_04730 [candidate division MSBL1 archaeon SCGC-AAA259J03]|uniref:Uncharacterized protein n=1 Tax=candidate division MSBL1 archaeon SCGC-AAA259J03 TaxID=1698269 RepID=A0A656YUV0_9EURY|nr:hypothetical protein AKJ39_04730 [candidate division MSBL1 archaeon SCGC-AAA259J03]
MTLCKKVPVYQYFLCLLNFWAQKEIGEIFGLSQNRISEVLGISTTDTTNISGKSDDKNNQTTQRFINTGGGSL